MPRMREINRRKEPAESIVSDAFDIERLLAREAWVRRVALAVAREASVAEDLAQDIWLNLLRRKPFSVGNRGGWLRSALRHRLADLARESRGRRQRERKVARSEDLPSTADLVARASAQRHVVEAVCSLAEPYRTVVLLRYFDDWTPTQIARAHGIPPATVRVRLKRALDQLRERLHEQFGDGRSLVIAVGGATFARGGRGRSIALASIASVAVLMIAVIGVWIDRESGGSHSGAPEFSEAWASTHPRRHRDDTAPPTVTVPADRSSPAESTESSASTPALHGVLTVKGAGVDDQVELVLGVERRVEGADADRQRPEFGRPGTARKFGWWGRARSGEKFAVPVDSRGLYYVAARAAGVRGFTSFSADPDFEKRGRLAVAPKIVLDVLDQPGLALQFASAFDDDGNILWEQARRAAGGSFSIPGPVFCGLPVRIERSGDAHAWTFRAVRDNVSIGLPSIRPSRRVRVIVSGGVSASSGLVVETQIRTSENTTWRVEEATDDAGVCTIPWPAGAEVAWMSIVVRGPDGAHYTTRNLREWLSKSADRLPEMRVRLEDNRRLGLEFAANDCTAPDSVTPLAGTVVKGFSKGLQVLRGVADVDGRVELRRTHDILETESGTDFAVVAAVEFDIFAESRVRGFFDLGTVRARILEDDPRIEIPRAIPLTVRVLDQADRPIAGAEIRIVPARDGQPVVRLARLHSLLVDDAGSAETIPLGPGSWCVICRAPGFAESQTIHEPSGGTLVVRLDRARAGSETPQAVRLRLVTPDGVALRGARVTLTRDDGRVMVLRSNGDGEVDATRVESGIRYQVGVTAPGYGVSLSAPLTVGTARARQSVPVARLGTMRFDLGPGVPQALGCLDGLRGGRSRQIVVDHGIGIPLTVEDQTATLYAPGHRPRALSLSAGRLDDSRPINGELEPGASFRMDLGAFLDATESEVDDESGNPLVVVPHHDSRAALRGVQHPAEHVEVGQVVFPPLAVAPPVPDVPRPATGCTRPRCRFRRIRPWCVPARNVRQVAPSPAPDPRRSRDYDSRA